MVEDVSETKDNDIDNEDRILASTSDEHREITAALKSKGEEFYTIPPIADRPLKVVIKGLPKSTTPEEIKDDPNKKCQTGDCPIKERLDTPNCINCDTDGHPANWRNCPAFPKTKNKKGAPAENRNKSIPNTFTSKLSNPNLSYANATTYKQQMAGPVDRSEMAKNSNSKPELNKKEESPPPQTDSYRLWANF
ncbi:hypothetical protein TNCV_4128401 [Trichonephila clavipes]|nr:hypothetical protein TNCV_4128401 [Trichonephila clavipes]